MGVNSRWRDALLDSSRTLRKRVLRGRIWGFGSPEQPEEPRKRRMPSTVDEEDDTAAVNVNGHARTQSTGRVRGMVQSFERSASSSSETEAMPLRWPRRQSTSGSISDRELNSEEERELLFASDAEREAEADGEAELAEGDITEIVTAEDVFVAEPVSELATDPATENGHAQEPSVEELLAAGEDAKPSWGAEAWEADVGATARRIETPIMTPGSASTKRSRNTGSRRGAPPLRDLFSPPPPDETRALISALESRVAALEARVEELAASEGSLRREVDDYRTRAVRLELAALEAEAKELSKEEEDPGLMPVADEDTFSRVIPKVSEIPAYVVLVGLGVCFTVVQSVMRRYGGRRS